jgi:regulatory protein
MKTESETLSGLAKYCSQAERCIDDVRKKIKTAGLAEDTANSIINRLIQEKFIDEQRFCRSFVNDKLKFNHWGRIKIGYELKRRNIKPETYSEAMDAVDENGYMSILYNLLKSKKRSVKGHSTQDTFQKLYRLASSRGFESSLIIKVLKDLLNNPEYEESVD